MQKNNSTLIIIVLLLAIIAVLGFFTFNKSGTQQDAASIKSTIKQTYTADDLNKYVSSEFAKAGIKVPVNIQPVKNQSDIANILSYAGIKNYTSLSEAIIANQNNQSNEKRVHVADTCWYYMDGQIYGGNSYPPGSHGNFSWSFGGGSHGGWCYEVWI